MVQLDDLTTDLAAGSGATYRLIAGAIANRIRDGRIAHGMSLPPSRELARMLGINRTTVVRAYEELAAEGLVESRVGSGTRVVGTALATPPRPQPRGPAATPPLRFTEGMQALARAATGDDTATGRPADVIDFSLLHPDEALFPFQTFRDVAVHVLATSGTELLQYGSAEGWLPLREAVAARLRKRGLKLEAEEVIIVNGSQQALDLLAKAFIAPGDAVAVESPTYAGVLRLLSLYRARVLSVPLTDAGVDVAALEGALASQAVKLYYTIPNFHNPTGITMTADVRKAVARLAATYGTVVVEDGYEEDLRFSGEEIPPLRTYDRAERVVYIGTFSKGLFPGLRMGYIVAPKAIRAMLVLAKRYADYHTDLLSQAVLAEFLKRGHYDDHLERIKKTYRERLATTLTALDGHFPPEARWSRPEGGFTLFVTFPPALDAGEVFEAAKRAGVLVTSGRHFYAGEAAEHGFRLSISKTDPERIQEGIKKLGSVLKQLMRRRGRVKEQIPAETQPLV